MVKRKGDKMKHTLLILFFILIILIVGCSSIEKLDGGSKSAKRYNDKSNDEGKTHIHADFKVYLEGKSTDFSESRYQLNDESVHLEDGIGELIHVHKKGITMGYFLETLHIILNKDCILIPVEGNYCKKDNKLSFYVNGIENDEFENYEIKDLDKILISYGGGDIKQQLESVTNLAITN